MSTRREVLGLCSCQSAPWGQAYPAGRSPARWAALEGRPRTHHWRGGDFYFAQCSDFLATRKYAQKASDAETPARKRPLGARKGQRRGSQQPPRWGNVIKARRKCGGGRGATCGAESRRTLGEFLSWDARLGRERRSGLCLQVPCCSAGSQPPCRREPARGTRGKGFRGILARRWLRSPAGARLSEAAAFTAGE